MSQTAEYALRAMVWLAAHSPEEPVRASDLSSGTGIPVHYLSKILRRLVLAGVLTSQKGQGGGFSLARSPEKIRFADILAAVDVYPTSDRCAFGWGDCSAFNPCPLHRSWSGLSRSVREWADTTTLADVEHDPDRKAQPGGGG
ncbi:MAG: Rrf2 family transcriptional regulator [Deltaproteobacteria bacterium]|nr:MAG: Rrf2 family transcriptional regulator [Deltaproteobacteria bacterium]